MSSSESEDEQPITNPLETESSSDSDDEDPVLTKNSGSKKSNPLFSGSEDEAPEPEKAPTSTSKKSKILDSSDSDDDDVMDTSNAQGTLEDTNPTANNNQLNIFGESSDEDEDNLVQGQNHQILDTDANGEVIMDDETMNDENDEDESKPQWQEYKAKPREMAKKITVEEESDSEDESQEEPASKKAKLSKKSSGSPKKKKSAAIDDSSSSSSSDSSDSSDSDSEPEIDDPEMLTLPKSPRPEDDKFLHEHLKKQIEKENDGTKLDMSDDENDPFERPIEEVEEKVVYIDSDENPDPNQSDFNWMLQKQKKKRQKRRGGKLDEMQVDDIINDLMKRMAEASTADKEACVQGIPAIQKLKLLPEVIGQFQIKANQYNWIDNGVMTALADWLTPLPNGALPNLKIRSSLLEALVDFPHCSTETLKASGIGKAINRLSHHKKEIKENKQICKKLTRRWCKQIFQINDTGGFSKEDRQMRDAEQFKKYGHAKRTKDQIKKEEERKASMNLKVTDPGFVSRARVPTMNNRDYLIRPKSVIDMDNMDMDVFKKKKKVLKGNALLMEKTKKKILELDRKNKKLNKCASVKIMKF